MASVSFTDAVGAATVQSAWPVPANRFGGWTPFARPIGEGAHALGTGQRYQWRFRTDYGAAFEIRGIANSDVDLAMRLQAHLLSGGTCTVTTGDAASRAYATCCLAPGTEPELDFSDPQVLEYTLRLTVIDVSASPVLMECVY